MTQKWNLQDIRPAEPRKRPSVDRPLTIPPRTTTSSSEDIADDNTIESNPTKYSKNKLVLLSVGAIALIGAIFGLSALLSKTTLTVYPEFNEPVVNAEFTAYPDRRESALSYEVITIEATKEKQVTASGEEYVESLTKGFIEIKKTTAGSERLVKNTRFRTAEGLIFRIQDAVVVPGATKDAAGTLVPGAVRAEVVADAMGQEYNLAANTRLDVPGFKESNLNELYNSIYATNPDALTGGFKGQKFIINDTELSQTRQELQLQLREELLVRIKSEKPAGFIAFDSSAAITYQELPTVSYGENLVTIRQQATLQMPLFKQEDFAAYLAKETISTYDRQAVRIVDASVLEFSYPDPTTSSSNLANLTSITFKITGKPTIVSEFDAEQLQKDLAGKSKTSISTVLTAHPGIKSARVASKPFWRRAFPTEAEDIKIIEVIGEEK